MASLSPSFFIPTVGAGKLIAQVPVWELRSMTCKACSCHTKLLNNYFLFLWFPVSEQPQCLGPEIPALTLRSGPSDSSRECICRHPVTWVMGEASGCALVPGVPSPRTGETEVGRVSVSVTEKHKNLDPPTVDFSIQEIGHYKPVLSGILESFPAGKFSEICLICVYVYIGWGQGNKSKINECTPIRGTS